MSELVAYNLRFPGQVFDGQAGLHQNGFRDSDPAIGRYPTADPSAAWPEGSTPTHIRPGIRFLTLIHWDSTATPGEDGRRAVILGDQASACQPHRVFPLILDPMVGSISFCTTSTT